ncbi:MAG: ATP-grasp domain-containing protein [Dehalococcoidales bacterium]|jgi:D-alanine-D-alanine ligase|nr:ATP-grasp domain-containing protein [Dehalococcoidales bacterium]
MHKSIAIIYNQPAASPYRDRNEQSAEDGVLVEVAAVEKALHFLGYLTSKIPLALPLEQAFSELSLITADIVFNLFEGFSGFPETEALIVEQLEALKLRYTGSPAAALKLALDKAETKTVLKQEGILTPAFQLLDNATLSDFKLNFPCIVKPNAEDASHSLNVKSVVYDYDALKDMVSEISGMYGKKALVEEYIDGREFNMTIMGNNILTTLPISEICFSLPQDTPKILSYEAKWDTESVYYRGTLPQCPADIDTNTKRNIVGAGLKAYTVTGCCGYARIDMRMDGNNDIYVLEVNPNPDISPDAGAAIQASAAGMSYNDFIQKIVQLAMERDFGY